MYTYSDLWACEDCWAVLRDGPCSLSSCALPGLLKKQLPGLIKDLSKGEWDNTWDCGEMESMWPAYKYLK